MGQRYKTQKIKVPPVTQSPKIKKIKDAKHKSSNEEKSIDPRLKTIQPIITKNTRVQTIPQVRAIMNKRPSILSGPNPVQWDTIPVRSYSLMCTTFGDSNIRHPVIEGMGSILPNLIIHKQGGPLPSVSQNTPSDVWTHKCRITNDTSNKVKWDSAADAQTGEQYSKTGKIKLL